MGRIAATLALTTALAAPAAARPASVEHLFREFGLFGAWAANCGEAASPDNPRVTVAMPEPGRVVERHDFGPGYETNRYVILSARRIAAGRLGIEARFEQGDADPEQQRIILRVEGRERRTLFNVPSGEEPRVIEGIAIVSGLPTPTLTKCE